MARTNVFISYSHKDKKWLERLQVHLKPLERARLVDRWDDTRIKAGDEWRKEIRQALDAARVVVLLVSADFMASDFIAKDELPPLLAAAEQDDVRILSVILKPSLFAKTPSLSRFQTVNDPATPLIKMDEADQEQVFLDVAETVLAAVSAAGDEVGDGADDGARQVTEQVASARKAWNVPEQNAYFTGREDANGDCAWAAPTRLASASGTASTRTVKPHTNRP